MADPYPPVLQRPALLELARALGCRDNALRRDDCGDWRINGRQGHVYAVRGAFDRPETPGFQIFVIGCETVRQWSAVKSAMTSFTGITNDGDGEGAFSLARLPTLAEAEIIRRYVGVAKKREIGEEQLARLRSFAHEHGFQAHKPASLDPAALASAEAVKEEI